MLIDKLRDYYGFPSAEQADFIGKRTIGMPEAQQHAIAARIIESRAKRFGFPDISVLAKFLNDAGATKHKGFYWAVCDDCKAEYDYRFETCPKCLLAGKRSSGHKVKASDEAPGKNVIRWNQTTLRPDGKQKYCVECEHKDTSYCRWFGDPDHTCSREEYDYCECKKCCAVHKKANASALKR